MSPNVRRAMHQALDLVLDALAEDAQEGAPQRQRRKQAPVLPSHVTDETIRKANTALKRAGLPHL